MFFIKKKKKKTCDVPEKSRALEKSVIYAVDVFPFIIALYFHESLDSFQDGRSNLILSFFIFGALLHNT